MTAVSQDTLSAPLIKDFFRFFKKVEFADSGCWNWLASHDDNGYAWFYGKNNHKQWMFRAPRVVYSWFVGSIPAGLEIDHLCRNRGCVNPTHLEVVSHAENMRRSGQAKTHCKYGHEYTPENTRRDSKGRRSCKTCAVARDRLRWGPTTYTRIKPIALNREET